MKHRDRWDTDGTIDAVQLHIIVTPVAIIDYHFQSFLKTIKWYNCMISNIYSFFLNIFSMRQDLMLVEDLVGRWSPAGARLIAAPWLEPRLEGWTRFVCFSHWEVWFHGGF